MNATSMRALDARPARKPHEGQRFLVGVLGDRLADADRLAGIDAPGDGRLDRRGVERHAVVVARVAIRGDLPPPGDRAIERRARRHEPPAPEERKRRLVGVHVAGARAPSIDMLQIVIALFDRHAIDGRAAVFVREADAAVTPSRRMMVRMTSFA